MRIALAQINVTVGALEANCTRIADRIREAKSAGADLVVFPELALTGYPPEDLLFKPAFVQSNLNVLHRLIPASKGINALVGFVDRDRRGRLYNAVALLDHGRWRGTCHKMQLPNYGVFDEKRYFTPGQRPTVLDMRFSRSLLVARKKGRATSNKQLATELVARIGVSICEDIWVPGGPCAQEVKAGAKILVNLSASPYHAGKRLEREKLLIRRARVYGCWICYLNLVGGQDELVFDGGSLLVSPSGRLLFRAPQFEEGLFLVEAPQASRRMAQNRLVRPLAADREVFEALVLGLRDYVRKNRFSRVVLGLSGGIDSSLTVAIAVAALGKGAVTGVTMPSRYSSSETQADAKAVAGALGIELLTIPIEGMFVSALDTLRPVFKDLPHDVAEENLQARIRGVILMALSNKFGWLTLACGNKSELSSGYCTLYGDLVGGFAVIKDVPKTMVFRLGRTANRVFGHKVIPESVFQRPPTAELRSGQRDRDTLPPYPTLDAIVRAYVEERISVPRIRKRLRVPFKTLGRVLGMIDQSEYKRRQAPVGIKITPLAFGKDRRMPITNKFRET